MIPFENPINVQRAWVLWELFCTISTGTQLSIIMPPDLRPRKKKKKMEEKNKKKNKKKKKKKEERNK